MHEWQNRILNIFQAKIALTDEEQFALMKRWQKQLTLKRNDFLIQKDQTETNLFFVVNGSMRIYFPHNEEEICVGFAYDNNRICSYPSFISNRPSDYYIQALAKTDVTAISKADFYDLFDHYPKIERVWRMLEEDALMGKIEREVEMLTFTPEERYRI